MMRLPLAGGNTTILDRLHRYNIVFSHTKPSIGGPSIGVIVINMIHVQSTFAWV